MTDTTTLRPGDLVTPIDLCDCRTGRMKRIREALPDKCCIEEVRKDSLKVQTKKGSYVCLTLDWFKI